eukprot:4702644-Prymnesium_polylepis.1
MGSARATLCGGQAAVGIGAARGVDGGDGDLGYSGTSARTGSALNAGEQQTLRALTQQQLRLRGGAATQAPLDAEEQGG